MAAQARGCRRTRKQLGITQRFINPRPCIHMVSRVHRWRQGQIAPSSGGRSEPRDNDRAVVNFSAAPERQRERAAMADIPFFLFRHYSEILDPTDKQKQIVRDAENRLLLYCCLCASAQLKRWTERGYTTCRSYPTFEQMDIDREKPLFDGTLPVRIRCKGTLHGITQIIQTKKRANSVILGCPTHNVRFSCVHSGRGL